MILNKKPDAKLFAVLLIQDSPAQAPRYEARYDHQVKQTAGTHGVREADLSSCPAGTQAVTFGLKATQAAVLMGTHVTTVRRQAEREFSRSMGLPTQYEREKAFNSAQRETRLRNAA